MSKGKSVNKMFTNQSLLSGARTPPIEEDRLLINGYRNKPRTSDSRVVLIIESFQNVNTLVALLRNLLQQSTKVDSIVLVVPNPDLARALDAVDLVKATCVIQKVGGLSIVFKESGDDTVLLFVNNDAFDDFNDHRHIQRCYSNEPKQRGVVRLANKHLVVDINQVFQL